LGPMLAEFACGGIEGASPSWSTRTRRRPAPHRPATTTDCFPYHVRREFFGATTAMSAATTKPDERKHNPNLSNRMSPAQDLRGLPPCLVDTGAMTVAVLTDKKKKLPDHEIEMSMRPPPIEGKRALSCANSPTCDNPLGPVGSVRVVMNPHTGRPRRDFKTKEYGMEMQTGCVRKFDMDVHKYHASRETPVSFPGWRGYPPDFSPSGQPIDYMLAKASPRGILGEPRLTESWHRGEQPPDRSGDTSQFTKTRHPLYQAEIRHMKVYDPAAMMKVLKYPKVGSQTMKFGFRNT